ncbi:XRE family transcriptional regulator [Pseudomonas nicosulfuronedens]|uniref:Helix-turn-helix domain-containing protein n=1 Tax=Pseudomonas nicosulfuronedens TaxID=2571105 RepID=A0A5R9R3J5_9PSED|nr:XRE family transcriptional regulator [Pseudomonas nicosulfuronedens]MDH1010805.1 XRE family transcriptional regulator [Pseudomonas nicosulfuronedens]MDH1979103.1 XRE family transcriptional regulator [Pseudomonas nicosulfuronedens]MDH2026004.1 XRE family transcriptional regulator [Pseudomonas nicosulfuronedens]TLX77257.1 helix-turn-helix domain-containing protein [Pseudomonas nicosulfuronedens]
MRNIMRKKARMSNILPTPSERPSVLVHVADNVKTHRRSAGFSQDALAKASGVSRRMLVGIESGDTNVSLATLDRIAAALRVTFADLVRPPSTGGLTRVDAVAWGGQQADSRGTLLASTPATRQAELWHWSLAPGDRYNAEPDAEGWYDMAYVIEGRLTIVLAEETVDVEAGGFHVFKSNQPFSYQNHGDVLVRFVRNVVN